MRFPKWYYTSKLVNKYCVYKSFDLGTFQFNSPYVVRSNVHQEEVYLEIEISTLVRPSETHAQIIYHFCVMIRPLDKNYLKWKFDAFGTIFDQEFSFFVYILLMFYTAEFPDFFLTVTFSTNFEIICRFQNNKKYFMPGNTAI